VKQIDQKLRDLLADNFKQINILNDQSRYRDLLMILRDMGLDKAEALSFVAGFTKYKHELN